METSNILDQEVNAQIDNHVRIDPLLSCYECEFDCETDDEEQEQEGLMWIFIRRSDCFEESPERLQ